MGCIDASTYTGDGTNILGTFTGIDALSDCQEACGVCCKILCNWVLDCSYYGSIGDYECSLSGNSLFFNYVGSTTAGPGTTGGVALVGQSAVLHRATSAPSSIIWNTNYPDYEGTGYVFVSDATAFCEDNGNLSSSSGEAWYTQERSSKKITKYYECINGILVDKTSQALAANTALVYADITTNGLNPASLGAMDFDIISDSTVDINNYEYQSWASWINDLSASNQTQEVGTSVFTPTCSTTTSTPAPPSTTSQPSIVAQSTTPAAGSCPTFCGVVPSPSSLSMLTDTPVTDPGTYEYSCEDGLEVPAITQTECLAQNGTWHPGLTCATADCSVLAAPV